MINIDILALNFDIFIKFLSLEIFLGSFENTLHVSSAKTLGKE
jgi:hypothetical protein